MTLRILYIAVHSHEGWGAEYWLSKSFKRLGVHVIPLDYRALRASGGNAKIREAIQSYDNQYDIIFLQRADHIPVKIFDDIKQPIVLWSTELLHRRKDIDPLLHSHRLSWLFVHSYSCVERIKQTFSHHTPHMSVLHNATPKETIHDDNIENKYFALFNRSLSFRRRWWLYPSRHLIQVQKNRYGDDYFNDLRESHVAVNIHYSKYIDFETGIFEAMSAGCAVVSESLHSQTLLDLNMKQAIIQVSSPKQLKEVLLELKNNKDTLFKYRKRSIESIHKNTWDKRAQQIIDVLNEVVKSNGFCTN
jgi:hypothetical protein